MKAPKTCLKTQYLAQKRKHGLRKHVLFLLRLADCIDWISVTYWMVGHKMMNIMTAFPPAHRQSATKVGNEDTNHCIYDEIMGNASVACIVRREHDLMLQADQHAEKC